MSNNEDYEGLSGWQKVVFEAARTFGVPTVLLLLGAYCIGWVILPPAMDTMTRFLNSTVETQKVLGETQKEISKSQERLATSQEDLVVVVQQISDTCSQISQVEVQSQEFMKTVSDEHKQQDEHLGTIEQKVEEIHTAVKQE